jgi:hypothetical protein
MSSPPRTWRSAGSCPDGRMFLPSFQAYLLRWGYYVDWISYLPGITYPHFLPYFGEFLGAW